jgi:hypothetical protein
VQKDINMSLLEFESVVVNAIQREVEAADATPAADVSEPQAVA